MATNERALPELDCVNLANDWPNWKRNFMVYMIANNKSAEPEATKIAIFLWLVGSGGANIYNTLFPNDGSQNSLLGTIRTADDAVMQRSLDDVITAFDRHCIPQRNVAMETFKFNVIAQKERQTFLDFETELRTQVRNCNFACTCGEKYEDRMLRDRIIVGVQDKKLQLKLLDGRDEQLSRVIDICKTYEAANANKSILDAKVTTLNAITTNENMESTSIAAITRSCYNCGLPWKFEHLGECKARDISCRNCGRKGHFQKFCRRPRAKQSTAGDNNNGNNNNNVTARQSTTVAGLNWGDIKGKFVNKLGNKLSSLIRKKKSLD